MRISSTLTDKERRFVAAYLGPAKGSATEAAIAAGYTSDPPERANTAGWRLLQRPHVQAALAVEQERLMKKYAVTQDRVIQELARIAFCDIRRAFHNGNLLPIEAIDDETAAAIEYYNSSDKGVRVRFGDKNAALVSLCRTLGLFKDKINLSFDIEDLFKRDAPQIVDAA